jgi:hypothetical protein
MAWSPQSRICHFHTKIVGVSHKNPDGSSRQKLIRSCRLFEDLVLDHEEHNPHDPNAVRVCRENGHQLGYLNANLAEEVVSKSSKGYRFGVLVKDLTGGGKGESLGVNLLIVQADPGVDDRQVKEYVKTLIREDPELRGAKIDGGSSGRFLILVLLVAIGAIAYFFMRRN